MAFTDLLKIFVVAKRSLNIFFALLIILLGKAVNLFWYSFLMKMNALYWMHSALRYQSLVCLYLFCYTTAGLFDRPFLGKSFYMLVNSVYKTKIHISFRLISFELIF